MFEMNRQLNCSDLKIFLEMIEQGKTISFRLTTATKEIFEGTIGGLQQKKNGQKIIGLTITAGKINILDSFGRKNGEEKTNYKLELENPMITRKDESPPTLNVISGEELLLLTVQKEKPQNS